MTRILFAALLLSFAACLPTVRGGFYSKNGRSYAPIAARAVIVDGDEEQAVLAAGGEIIGTISARAIMTTMNASDVASWAASLAARDGGTHLAVVEQGVVTTTYTNPATETRSCTRGDGTRSCETTSMPETTSSSDVPYAQFEVIRLPAERWAALPDGLRPSPPS
jgi:hypothetical protein